MDYSVYNPVDNQWVARKQALSDVLSIMHQDQYRDQLNSSSILDQDLADAASPGSQFDRYNLEDFEYLGLIHDSEPTYLAVGLTDRYGDFGNEMAEWVGWADQNLDLDITARRHVDGVKWGDEDPYDFIEPLTNWGGLFAFELVDGGINPEKIYGFCGIEKENVGVTRGNIEGYLTRLQNKGLLKQTDFRRKGVNGRPVHYGPLAHPVLDLVSDLDSMLEKYGPEYEIRNTSDRVQGLDRGWKAGDVGGQKF